MAVLRKSVPKEVPSVLKPCSRMMVWECVADGKITRGSGWSGPDVCLEASDMTGSSRYKSFATLVGI